MAQFIAAKGKGRSAVAFVSGLLFGSGLITSDMVNPQKVLAFLDITGKWDPSLGFVILGALLVFAPFYHLIIKKRFAAEKTTGCRLPTNKAIDSRLISGAIIFGVGWGMAGFCPGPIIASLAGGNLMVLAFFCCMLLGMWLAKPFFVANRV